MLQQMTLPRVTEILRVAGLTGDMRFVPEYALARGTALHLATQFLDEGTLDRSSVDPAIEKRLAEYERWKQESGVAIESWEQEVRSAAFRYCGHYDRIITLNGRRYVLDIKNGVPAAWHGPQTAAYHGAYNEQNVQRVAYRCSLYLNDDTPYRFHEHADRDDWSVFLHARGIYAWKEKHGLIESAE